MVRIWPTCMKTVLGKSLASCFQLLSNPRMKRRSASCLVDSNFSNGCRPRIKLSTHVYQPCNWKLVAWNHVKFRNTAINCCCLRWTWRLLRYLYSTLITSGYQSCTICTKLWSLYDVLCFVGAVAVPHENFEHWPRDIRTCFNPFQPLPWTAAPKEHLCEHFTGWAQLLGRFWMSLYSTVNDSEQDPHEFARTDNSAVHFSALLEDPGSDRLHISDLGEMQQDAQSIIKLVLLYTLRISSKLWKVTSDSWDFVHQAFLTSYRWIHCDGACRHLGPALGTIWFAYKCHISMSIYVKLCQYARQLEYSTLFYYRF